MRAGTPLHVWRRCGRKNRDEKKKKFKYFISCSGKGPSCSKINSPGRDILVALRLRSIFILAVDLVGRPGRVLWFCVSEKCLTQRKAPSLLLTSSHDFGGSAQQAADNEAISKNRGSGSGGGLIRRFGAASSLEKIRV